MTQISVDDRILRQMIQEHPQKVSDWLDGVAESITNEIKLSFGDSPPGKTYGRHVASLPGYPPNVDTGNLRASMRWRADGRLTRIVEDGTMYGVELELGLRSNVAARPFVRPVFARWQANLAEDMRRHLF